jgi:hypothetical protein
VKIRIAGKILAASSAAGLAKAMHRRALFDQDKNLQQYMEAVAARSLAYSGRVIRTRAESSPDVFIADLAEADQ